MTFTPDQKKAYAKWIDAFVQLRRVGAIGTYNNPNGDIAENAVCSALGLQKAPTGTRSFDATDKHGRRYQIKSRWYAPGGQTKSVSLGNKKGERDYDELIIVLVAEDGKLDFVGKVARLSIDQFASNRKRIESVAKLCEDITESIVPHWIIEQEIAAKESSGVLIDLGDAGDRAAAGNEDIWECPTSGLDVHTTYHRGLPIHHYKIEGRERLRIYERARGTFKMLIMGLRQPPPKSIQEIFRKIGVKWGITGEGLSIRQLRPSMWDEAHLGWALGDVSDVFPLRLTCDKTVLTGGQDAGPDTSDRVDKITSGDFFGAFRETWSVFSRQESMRWCDIFDNRKLFTNKLQMPGGIFHKTMQRLSNRNRNLRYQKEWYTVDALFVSGEDLFLDDLLYPSEVHVLIEHEFDSDLEEELWKLIHWRAPLKVLIGYDWCDSEKTTDARRGFVDKKIHRLKYMISAVERFNQEGGNAEYLLILGRARNREDDVSWTPIRLS